MAKQEPNDDDTGGMNGLMTLAAATALFCEDASKKEESKLSPKNLKQAPVTSTTPPPDYSHPDSASPENVALVSPPTPKSSNRSVQCIGVKPPAKLPAVPPTKLPAVPPAALKPSFARVLMDVLLNDSYSEIITFLPDGDSFAILNPKKFADEVMPKHFSIRTLSPFVRKLHRWGFERILDKKTHDVDVFRHPLFIRGNYALCDKIKCIGRLVKGPIEQAILLDASEYSNQAMLERIALAQQQDEELRKFIERTNLVKPLDKGATTNKNFAQAYLLQSARQTAMVQQAAQQQQQASLLQQQSALLQRAAQRLQQEQEQKASLLEQAQLRQAAQQMLLQRQQAEQNAAAKQLLLSALQNRSREEEMLSQELERQSNEELLRQQLIAGEAKQERLRNLLAAQQQGGIVPDRAVAPSKELQLSMALQAAMNKKRSPLDIRQYL